MRLLFIGDVVGAPGMAIVRRAVPLLRQRERLDLVVANAENAANGAGLTPNLYRQLRAAGVDAVTLGDHIYKKFEIESVLADPAQPVVKPANFPASAPGRDHAIVAAEDGTRGASSDAGRGWSRRRGRAAPAGATWQPGRSGAGARSGGWRGGPGGRRPPAGWRGRAGDWRAAPRERAEGSEPTRPAHAGP